MITLVEVFIELNPRGKLGAKFLPFPQSHLLTVIWEFGHTKERQKMWAMRKGRRWFFLQKNINSWTQIFMTWVYLLKVFRNIFPITRTWFMGLPQELWGWVRSYSEDRSQPALTCKKTAHPLRLWVVYPRGKHRRRGYIMVPFREK